MKEVDTPDVGVPIPGGLYKYKVNNLAVLRLKELLFFDKEKEISALELFLKSSIETVIEAIKSLTGLEYKIEKGDNEVIKEVIYFKKTNKK